MESEGVLEFHSYHKRAIRGFGSKALGSLETILGFVAKDLGRDIRLQFKTFNQPDTKKWLEKNKYTLINPEKASIAHEYFKDIRAEKTISDETLMADALKRFINLEKAEVHIGDWKLNNLLDDDAMLDWIELSYKGSAANYGFQIIVPEDQSSITFYNFHREAEPGNGTPTLQFVERSLGIVAKDIEKDINIVFSKRAVEQPTTRVWLEKNKYILDNQGIFYKQIKK